MATKQMTFGDPMPPKKKKKRAKSKGSVKVKIKSARVTTRARRADQTQHVRSHWRRPRK